MAKTFTEQATVQTPLVNYASEVGWRVLAADDAVALRQGEGGLFLYEILRDQLLELNAGVVTAENVDEIIARLENVRPSIEGNEETLLWVRGQRSIYVDSERREINVQVIDFENIDRNVF